MSKERYVRDTVGEGRRRRGGGKVGRAHQHFDADGSVVDLDAVESRCSLDSLVVLVEDDGSATEATTGRSILQQDLLGAANTNCGRKVILRGALVVVIGKSLRSWKQEYESMYGGKAVVESSSHGYQLRKRGLMSRRRTCAATRRRRTSAAASHCRTAACNTQPTGSESALFVPTYCLAALEDHSAVSFSQC
jgi:hypothetical protein